MARVAVYVRICLLSMISGIIGWILFNNLGLTVTYKRYVESAWIHHGHDFQRVSGLEQITKKCLCIRTGARLGNNMYAYASALGLARNKGMILVASTGAREVFTLDSTCDTQIELWGQFCETAKMVYEKDETCNAFDENIWNIDASHHTRITGCLRSWKYLVGHESAIRSAFTFREHIHRAALEVLRGELVSQGKEGFTSHGGVLVGVHVRRGDRLLSQAFIVPPKEYFQRAMTFMRQKFRSLTFVVCSDDLAWSRRNLFSTDTVFIESGRAEVDFRVLSLCNHTIMSVGTFGWWAAWLANGTTVYYKHAFTKGQGSDLHTNMSEYMPTHWIPMV